MRSFSALVAAVTSLMLASTYAASAAIISDESVLPDNIVSNANFWVAASYQLRRCNPGNPPCLSAPFWSNQPASHNASSTLILALQQSPFIPQSKHVRQQQLFHR